MLERSSSQSLAPQVLHASGERQGRRVDGGRGRVPQAEAAERLQRRVRRRHGDSPDDDCPGQITACTKISSTFPLNLFFRLPVILTRVVLCPSRSPEDARMYLGSDVFRAFFVCCEHSPHGLLSALLSFLITNLFLRF